MTTPIPVEAGGVLEFTPECLDHLPMKPVIYLRWPERRHKQMVQPRMIEEGVERYSDEEWRECFLEGFKEGWGQEVYDEDEPRIRELWDAVEQYEKEKKLDPEFGDFVPPGTLTVEHYDQLVRDVTEYYRPLRTMNAASFRSEQLIPVITVSIVVQGWINLGIECPRKAGLISVETAFELRDAINEIERLAYPDDQRTLQAWNEIWLECSKRLYLTAEQRKNLSSPVQSNASLNGSNDGQASTDGQSTEQEPSTKTQSS